MRHVLKRTAPAIAGLLPALLVVLLCFGVADADAKKQKKAEPKPDISMQFAIVRASGQACEPNCPEWISADGEILPGTVDRFRKFLKTIGKRRLPVVIQSPGGSVDAAQAIGRLIRARGLDVAVGYTTFTSCAPRRKDCDAGKTGGYRGIAAAGYAYCYSACPLVLASGTRRLVGSWASLGVHQVTTTYVTQRISYEVTTRIVHGKKVVKKKIVGRKNTGTYATTKLAKGQRKQIESYLAEMGVSTALVDLMVKTPAADILRLDQNQMLGLKLITGMEQVFALTDARICNASPAPANCRADATASKPKDEGGAARVWVVAKLPPPSSTVVAAPVPKDAAGAARVWVVETLPPPSTTAAAPLPADVTDGRPVSATLGLAMEFAVIRGHGRCEPDCPQWIAAEGTIGPNSAERLRHLLETSGRTFPVLVSSPGGDVGGALALGELIRTYKIDVAVARTYVGDCSLVVHCPGTVPVGAATDARGECRDACVLVLAAGTRRFVGPTAKVVVHGLDAGQTVRDYLVQMGVAPEIFASRRVGLGGGEQPLRQRMMRLHRLTTGPEAADALVSTDICGSNPRPDNCILAAATK